MSTFETPAGELAVSSDHPGGNAAVLELVDGTLRLRPETRDSSRAWFYWNVAVESERARQLRVVVDDHVSPRGPAVRRAGEPWRWLGADDREDDSTFTYAFDAGERVQFALAPAYQVTQFRAACDRDGLDPAVLTESECGRSVPLVRIGRDSTRDGGGVDGTGTDEDATRHVVLTARHHACESTASYVLEGFLAAAADAVLPDDVTVHAVPFVDVDGVERGDHGKHRAPHDHNRDYVDGNALGDFDPIYQATAAVMDYVEALAATGDLAVALDLHCPFKWGGDNDRPFLVAPPADHGAAVASLVDALADATAGATLSFDPTPGVGVHQFDGQSGQVDAFSTFADRRGATLATTLEVPYVGTAGDPVTPASAREFGRALAGALASTLAR